jgi:DNA-binding MarR family transcriptional regulator
MEVTSKGQKNETTRLMVHSILELRDELRQFMQRKFKENNIDLTYEMHQVMACLWKKDGINQQELADRTLRDKAAITFLIDNLGKRGLVIREEHPGDRRSKLIYLTNRGKLLGKTVKPWVNELFSIAGNGITAATLKECIKTIEKMCENVRTS